MPISNRRSTPLGTGSTRRGSGFRVLESLLFVTLVLGCAPPRGEWSLDALLEEYPSIEELGGQRLGDMLPFPALDGDRIILLACRFPTGPKIRVAGDGPGWSEQWARWAISALDREARGYHLELLTPSSPDVDRGDLEIQVRSMELASETGPRGLADTLSECDVSRKDGTNGAFRGLLVKSEIRIKRSRLDWTGVSREAMADEWVGALMHEIGHALGFAGHAARGDSILVREQSRLRASGRRALAGEAWRDETLEALYRLRPGQKLGSRPLRAETISILHEIREIVARDSSASSRRVEMRSSVGDREGRIQWQLSDGSRLGIRLKNWRDELESGGEITFVPDRATRQRLVRQRKAAKLLVD